MGCDLFYLNVLNDLNVFIFVNLKKKNFIRNVFNDIIDKFDLDSYLDYVLWYNWFFVVD